MKYMFFRGVNKIFIDNILCIAISEDFSKQYRIFTDGDIEELNPDIQTVYTKEQVDRYISNGWWERIV